VPKKVRHQSGWQNQATGSAGTKKSLPDEGRLLKKSVVDFLYLQWSNSLPVSNRIIIRVIIRKIIAEKAHGQELFSSDVCKYKNQFQ
jgi:hypothetical protein